MYYHGVAPRLYVNAAGFYDKQHYVGSETRRGPFTYNDLQRLQATALSVLLLLLLVCGITCPPMFISASSLPVFKKRLKRTCLVSRLMYNCLTVYVTCS